MAEDKIYPVLVDGSVPAGFPSPASDYSEKPLDLNAQLITHPSATFLVRARGDSMIGAGISNADLLIVNRAFKAKSGDIVVVFLDGDFTVKRLSVSGKTVELHSENPGYKPINLTEHSDAEIWGVVTYVIKKTR